ncbi:hypothetical protein [Nakamurella lactea]|uniref:hypothetical protein n=1 Tax=Nakamurella lactea TaxID=459515 RepID=UPI000428D7A3|nr:hypothetical protein [Nakamurella lactea]
MRLTGDCPHPEIDPSCDSAAKPDFSFPTAASGLNSITLVAEPVAVPVLRAVLLRKVVDGSGFDRVGVVDAGGVVGIGEAAVVVVFVIVVFVIDGVVDLSDADRDSDGDAGGVAIGSRPVVPAPTVDGLTETDAGPVEVATAAVPVTVEQPAAATASSDTITARRRVSPSIMTTVPIRISPTTTVSQRQV